MGFIAVIVAAAAGYAFGAGWYMALAKPWMAASGVDPAAEKAAGRSSPLPFAIGFVAALATAGMLRHVFVASGLSGGGAGLVSGLGVGLFIVAPWIATSYAFQSRPMALSVIDGGHVAGACAVIGLVLGLFL